MTFQITIDGFKTKEESKEFMNWIREEGEDLFRDYLERIGMVEPEKEQPVESQETTE